MPQHQTTTFLERTPAALLAVSLLSLLTLVRAQADFPAQTASLTIQMDKPGVKISPDLYGIFFEEINRAGDGGLYAEMIQNRFLCSRAVLPGMIARRRGRIINVPSGAANSYIAHATGYSASKAALTNWAGGLAAAAKEHGIAVFAWDLGFVRTAMSEFLAESDEVRRWFGDTFQQWFETGQDIPIERSAGQFMVIASGRLDALSGRQLSVEQDLLDLANRAGEIERDDLLTLRLRI